MDLVDGGIFGSPSSCRACASWDVFTMYTIPIPFLSMPFILLTELPRAWILRFSVLGFRQLISFNLNGT